jgi:hypothetical protein
MFRVIGDVTAISMSGTAYARYVEAICNLHVIVDATLDSGWRKAYADTVER